MLTLTKNKISQIDGEVFIKNLNLQIMKIDENPLQFVDEKIFDNKLNLKQIKMGGCVNKEVTIQNENVENEIIKIKEEIREKCNKN
jgi:hypothetical protein